MFPSEQFNLIPVLERKFVPRIMLYLTLLLSNTKTFCWLMRLFLSNSGNLKSCIVTTPCVLRQPVRVVTSSVPPSNLVIIPFGKADLLIIETFKPESKSTQKSLQLLMVPIVSVVQMVMGNSCSRILICLDFIAIIFKSYGCIPSRGIRVVGERYFQCGKSWIFHQTHGVFIMIKSYFMMALLKGSCVSTRISNLT
jgi:hypothetical protein